MKPVFRLDAHIRHHHRRSNARRARPFISTSQLWLAPLTTWNMPPPPMRREFPKPGAERRFAAGYIRERPITQTHALYQRLVVLFITTHQSHRLRYWLIKCVYAPQGAPFQCNALYTTSWIVRDPPSGRTTKSKHRHRAWGDRTPSVP